MRMLTSFSDDEPLFDAIMAGAAGYAVRVFDDQHVSSRERHLGPGN